MFINYNVQSFYAALGTYSRNAIFALAVVLPRENAAHSSGELPIRPAYNAGDLDSWWGRK